MKKILDIADVVRSKNAGPFEFTLDVIFKNREFYQKAKDSGVITKENMAKLYKLSPDRINTLVWFEQANAVKITMLRTRPSGRMGDHDVYGAQQHAPLLTLEFPF